MINRSLSEITHIQHSRIFPMFMCVLYIFHRLLYSKSIHFKSSVVRMNHLREPLKFNLFMPSIDATLIECLLLTCARVCVPFRSIRPYNCYWCCFCATINGAYYLSINYLFIYSELSVVLILRNEVFARVFIYFGRVVFHRMGFILASVVASFGHKNKVL